MGIQLNAKSTYQEFLEAACKQYGVDVVADAIAARGDDFIEEVQMDSRKVNRLSIGAFLGLAQHISSYAATVRAQ